MYLSEVQEKPWKFNVSIVIELTEFLSRQDARSLINSVETNFRGKIRKSYGRPVTELNRYGGPMFFHIYFWTRKERDEAYRFLRRRARGQPPVKLLALEKGSW